MPEILTGRVGRARQVPLANPPLRPEWAATVAAWLCDLPGWSPAWRHYLISVVHLRDIPGVRPALRKYPSAEYEFIVGALDPAQPPNFEAEDPLPFNFLSPLNVVEQFHDMDDAAAAALVRAVVEHAIRGEVILEPDGIVGAREHWREVLRGYGAAIL
jgi:hypothetical protein